jgi:hypothetical protein
VQAGLWSKPGRLNFCIEGVISRLSTEKEHPVNTIPVTTLDVDIWAVGGTVDFIKMDIEGAEIEAIRGAIRTLKENNVHLAIASYHWCWGGRRTADVLKKMFPEYGYNVSTGYPIHLTTYAWRERQ